MKRDKEGERERERGIDRQSDEKKTAQERETEMTGGNGKRK